MIKRAKPLDSITTLRGTEPGGNSRNFVNMKPPLGRESFRPKRLGCSDEGWEKTGRLGPFADKV